jgi:glycosyltransferase involved in cell wall biosynthesis
MSSLLLAGLRLPGSGLTNVLEALVTEFRRTRAVRCLGFEPAAQRGEEDIAIHGCPMHVRRGDRAFVAAPQWLEREFAEHHPDVVLVNGPGILAGPLLQQLQRFRDTTHIVLYLPVEGTLAGDAFAPVLALADTCVTYTEDAREGVRAMCTAAAARDAGYRMPRLAAVGHGFDSSAFFPLAAFDERARRIAARRALYGDGLDDAFIVLNCNRPYYRKRLDLTVAAFALFARDKGDAHLHLHTGGRSAAADADLSRAIAESGVAERIHVTPRPGEERVRSTAWLNTLYNACDVGLTTAMGEGWGLTLFEHAATRAALVAPAHTSFVENWSGAAMLVAAPGREFIFYEASNMSVVDPADVAAALEILYRDRSLRDDLASSAFARAQHERYTWKWAASRLAALL